jgi:acylphosphatase
MFRQTVIRAALARGLVAGATNVRTDRGRVDVSLRGDRGKIRELVDGLRSGKRLNSWGARCTSVEEMASGRDPLEHEVNTANVDDIEWVQGVSFYL